MKNKKICIFGSSGFAKEVLLLAKDCGYDVEFFVDLHTGNLMGCDIIKEEEFDYCNIENFNIVVAVGSPKLRKKIVDSILLKNPSAEFQTLIHPSAKTMGLKYDWSNISIGKGSVICANCILTGDIKLGDFSQLNLSTTIGHDVKAGDYFTTAPGVHINGNNNIGNQVYFGSNTSTVENIKIVDNITIGANACVTKDLFEAGTYIGLPAKKLEKKNG